MANVLNTHTEYPPRAGPRRVAEIAGLYAAHFPRYPLAGVAVQRTLARLTRRECSGDAAIFRSKLGVHTVRAMFDKGGFAVVSIRRSQVAEDTLTRIPGLLTLSLRVLNIPPVAVGSELKWNS